MKSSPHWAQVGWAKSGAPAIHGSTVKLPSRSFALRLRMTRKPFAFFSNASAHRSSIQPRLLFSISRTTHLLDTLCSKNEFENPAEVEVTDPFHPLFGRRFPLISSSSTITGPGYVWVAYRDYMRLRIPLSATSLVSSGPISRTKFTRQGLEELLALASEYEGLCQSTPQRSGRPYQDRSDSKSKKNSSPYSRR